MCYTATVGEKVSPFFEKMVLGEAKMKSQIHTGCGIRRMELMRYLLLQTSLVRGGVKPAEILTVSHCYCASDPERTGSVFHSQTSSNLPSSDNFTEGFCILQGEVLRRLGLPWKTLRHRDHGSLTIFYDPQLLAETLAVPAVQKYLRRNGYSDCETLDQWLARLAERFETESFPHEVGLFLGYPLKDVVGFIFARARHTHQGSWRVYGRKEPSLQLMDRYRRARQLAETIVDQVEDWDQCVQKISSIKSLI